MYTLKKNGGDTIYLSAEGRIAENVATLTAMCECLGWMVNCIPTCIVCCCINISGQGCCLCCCFHCTAGFGIGSSLIPSVNSGVASKSESKFTRSGRLAFFGVLSTSNTAAWIYILVIASSQAQILNEEAEDYEKCSANNSNGCGDDPSTDATTLEFFIAMSGIFLALSILGMFGGIGGAVFEWKANGNAAISTEVLRPATEDMEEAVEAIIAQPSNESLTPSPCDIVVAATVLGSDGPLNEPESEVVVAAEWANGPSTIPASVIVSS